MSCGYSINIKEIVDEIMKVLPKGEDDYVESGEVINGGKTLRLTRKKGGTIDIALPTPPTVDDIYINKAEIVANGPNKDLVLTNNKGEKLSVTLPTASAPAPAEDKYVTDFSLANRGGKPVLEIRRSDNVTLTASLPENSGGGGGSGTDDYVTAGALTVQREKGGAEVRKTFYANLKLTRKGGGEVDVDMSKLISTAQDNPEFTPRMDINNELSRVVKADGYYVTAPETMRWAKDDSSFAAVVGLPAPALWFDASGAGTQVAPGRKLLPIMDLHWGKPYGNDKMGLTQDALCYTRADGTQSWILIPQAGGGGSGSGISSITPSTTQNRTIVVTDNGGNISNIRLPDKWFNGKDGKDGKDGFVSVEEYNALAEKTILSSWAASSIRKGFDTSILQGGKYDYVPFGVFTTADGKPSPFQPVNQFATIPHMVGGGNDYSIVLLNQPGDSSNTAHKHNPLPYLRSIGHEGALKAIDVFEWRLVDDPDSSSNKTLRAVYRGTVYAQDDVGNGILLYPLAGMYLPGDPDKSNYAGQMPPAFEFRIRNTNADYDVAYDPSVVFKNSYQITPSDIRPVF